MNENDAAPLDQLGIPSFPKFWLEVGNEEQKCCFEASIEDLFDRCVA
jgi:hypothetical protein